MVIIAILIVSLFIKSLGGMQPVHSHVDKFLTSHDLPKNFIRTISYDEDSEIEIIKKINLNKVNKSKEKIYEVQIDDEEEAIAEFDDGLLSESIIEKDDAIELDLNEDEIDYNKFNDTWQEANVCVRMLTPSAHHASRFFRDFYRQFGGHTRFWLENSVWKNIKVNQKELEESGLFKHEIECDPKWPILYLIHRTDKTKLRPPGVSADHPVIRMVVADEACGCKFCDGEQVAFREFWSSKQDKTGKLIYIPLGPRYEFKLISDKIRSFDITKRKYLFNFVGSSVGPERMAIAKLIQKEGKDNSILKRGYVSMTSKWYKVPGKKKGGLMPSKYHKLLLNSAFTLCPQGFNYDTYRMYEAIESGSIPVVNIGQRYARKHTYGRMKCDDALIEFIETKAPFLWVENWSEFPKKIQELLENPEKLRKMQKDMLSWRKVYFSGIAQKFECRIFGIQKKMTGKSDLNLEKYCSGMPEYFLT